MREMRATRRRRFTLAEVMVALGAGMIAMVVALDLFVLPMRAWYNGVTLWNLDNQTRLVREKMLSSVRPGMNGVGLRSASRSRAKPGNSTQAEWVDFYVDQNAIPTAATGDDESWRIQWNHGLGLVSKDTGQPKDMVPSSITVSSVVFDMDASDRILNSTVTLQISLRKKIYSRTISSNIYLINP